MADDISHPATRRESASVGEVVEFVKTYAKQETLGPLKGAGRWIAVGAGSALLLGLGSFLLLLGLLRLLQTEFEGMATGGSSWLPYLIVLVVTLLFIGIALSRINKTFLSKEPQE